MRWVVRPLLFLLLTGCVSKGRYEIALVQRDATRIALSARSAEAIHASLDAESDKAALEAEIASRQAQLDALALEIATTRAARDALLGEKALWGTAPAAPPPELAQALASAADDAAVALRKSSREQEVAAAFAAVIERGATLSLQDDAVVVSIPSGLLFQEGWVTLSPRGLELVAEVVASLGGLSGRTLQIVGHAAPTPVHSRELPSAWERALLPAVALAREIASANPAMPLTASSRAAGEPPPAGQDADRVELWIEDDPSAAARFAPRE